MTNLPEPPNECRKEFEAWCRQNGQTGDVATDPNGNYFDSTNAEWKAWEAARNISANPTPDLEGPIEKLEAAGCHFAAHIVRQHLAAPDHRPLPEQANSTNEPESGKCDGQIPVVDSEIPLLETKHALNAAIRAKATEPRSEIPYNEDAIQGIIIDEMTKMNPDGNIARAKKAMERLLPYLRTTESVCPYIVTSPETSEGDGGTSYCSLAAKPEPVSITECLKAVDALDRAWDDRSAAKAVLDVAGVKYVD